MRQDLIRVLHMTKLGAGGISTLTVNINKLIDRSRFMFDYLVFENKKTFYEDTVYEFGGKKVVVDVEKYEDKKLVLYWKKYQLTKEMLRREHYDIVHVDGSTPMDVVIGLAAKHAGVKTRIIHSHIAGDNKHSLARTVYLSICRRWMKRTFTDYIAISEAAAKFMFPKSIYKKGKYLIVNNGIVADNYSFDENSRTEVRECLGIDKGCFVVGHIGRFSKEKNHDFLIDVFIEISKRNSNSKLLLVGEGDLVDQIKKKVNNLGLNEKVIFYGTTKEIPKLLCAMDCFVLPSTFEGLGIVAIEAQCSGLPTFCSEGIPDSAGITKCFISVKGNDSKEWADKIVNYPIRDRSDNISQVKAAGYDLAQSVQYLQKYYQEKTGRDENDETNSVNI